MKKSIERIANNDYFFSMITKIIGVMLALLLSIVVARYFGTNLKGIQSVIDNYVSIYSVFLGLGIYQAYPFYRKREKNLYPHFINNITTQFLIYELLAILISFLIYKGNHNLYLAFAIIFMPIAVYIKQLNYIVLIECPRRRNIADIVVAVSEIILLLVLWILIDASVYIVMIYYAVAQLVNLFISFYNLKINPLKIRLEVNRLREFARFGFIPMLVLLCMTINYKIDILMLEKCNSVALSDIGIYGLGVSLAEKVWLIPDAMKDILLSKLVKGKGEDEVAKILRINIMVCLLSIIALVIVGKPLLILLYGKSFEKSYYVMILMMLGVIGMIFYKMIYSYNISQGKRTVNLMFLGLAALVNIIGNYFMIPIWGIWGAAITSIISYNICGAAFAIYFHRVSKIPYRLILFVQKSDIALLKNMLCGS